MTPKGPEKDRTDRDGGSEELERAQEILARTMRFLARCSEDPEAAVKAEDPRELLRDLRELTAPSEPAPAKELPSIPLRKRRSA